MRGYAKKKKNVHTGFVKIIYTLSLSAFKIDLLFGVKIGILIPYQKYLPEVQNQCVPRLPADSLALRWGKESCVLTDHSGLFLKLGKSGKYNSNPPCKFQDVSPPHEATNFGLKYFWPTQLPNH